jgi:hypothetical protein
MTLEEFKLRTIKGSLDRYRGAYTWKECLAAWRYWVLRPRSGLAKRDVKAKRRPRQIPSGEFDWRTGA